LRLFANGRSVVFSAPANSSRFSCWDSIPGHFRRHDYARIRALLANLELVADGIYLYAFPLLFLTEWLPQESCERRRRNQTDTKASGQLLQSGRFIARLVDIGILPFRIAQGPFLRTK